VRNRWFVYFLQVMTSYQENKQPHNIYRRHVCPIQLFKAVSHRRDWTEPKWTDCIVQFGLVGDVNRSLSLSVWATNRRNRRTTANQALGSCNRWLCSRTRLQSEHLNTDTDTHTDASNTQQFWEDSLRFLKVTSILECGPMPNVMAALPNTVGALCSTPQILADARY